ncbi:GNAT family N-acetyltransferase [Photobacterium sp. WH24]|uniref:GNAT family N-acetyltransferase n=2 Tax=Photobacterium TaxID=657 RepID=UPI001C472D53|nr:GNAT family N-acetyltransferase [Photobacterium sp. WH24]MBV7263391.1 GNAT family N-acetyltransferase [Photobacterium sp. WH24]
MMDIVKNKTETSNSVWHVEHATLAEWQAVMAWAKDEGWDMGLGDANAFFEVDDQGFFIGYLGKEPVAAMSIVNYSSSFSFLGHYLVSPTYRGQGYGLKLCQSAFAHGGDRCMGLDGMPAQVDNYAKWGFAGGRNNLRMVGQVQQDYHCPDYIELVQAADIDDIVAYDKSCTGIDRSALLKHWFIGETRYGFICRTGQEVTGIVGVRQSQDGYRVGPLFANTPDLVEPLFVAALSAVPQGRQVTLDVPEKADPTLIKLAEKHGFESIFHTLRMYRGEPPKEQEHKVWCIASLELG